MSCRAEETAADHSVCFGSKADVGLQNALSLPPRLDPEPSV